MRGAAVALAAFLAFGGLLHAAAAPQRCTETGTQGRDMMAGGPGHDKLCALGGADYAHADGKGDIVLGGPGSDTLIGGAGRDRIKGGQDNDKLFSIDQRNGNDIVRGGRGIDHCFADENDLVYGCEHVNRSNGPEVTRALSTGFLGVTELGEEVQQETPSPSPLPLPSPSPSPSPSPTSGPPCIPPPFATNPPCA